jgi:hypothetical protein
VRLTAVQMLHAMEKLLAQVVEQEEHVIQIVNV